MANVLMADEIDWSVYEQQTDAQVLVRPASAFVDDLAAEFTHRDRSQRSCMFSTKLRDAIEFRPGEVTAWLGYSGHRKSMFVSQLALDLCVQREPLLLASFEMSPGKTLGRMARQFLAQRWPSRDNQQRFSQWSDGRLWLFDHMGRINAARVLGVCRYFVERFKGRHVVIDSLQFVVSSEEHLDEQKQFMTDLVRTAVETGLHIHLVTHARKPQNGDDGRPPTKYDLRGSASISDQAANVIVVWQNRKRREELAKGSSGDPDELRKPDALAVIEKQRNGEVEGKFSLWFDDSSLRFCDDRSSGVEPYVIEALS